MRFASLGSGSEGNALLVEAGNAQGRGALTRILVDCGFSIREIEQRLARLDCPAQTLQALLLTHEHADHVGSAYGFAAKYGIPIYLSRGTYLASSSLNIKQAEVRYCVADSPFLIGGLQIHPYTVPHDAREPVQFVLGDGKHRLGVLTDAGRSTPYLLECLQGVCALVLECNHDRQLLANSSYPISLKARIGGDLGHLANDAAATILSAIAHAQLQHVVAAHLSQQNNLPSLVRETLSAVLQEKQLATRLHLADQVSGLDWKYLD